MNKKEIIKIAENTLKRSKNIGSGKRLINDKFLARPREI